MANFAARVLLICLLLHPAMLAAVSPAATSNSTSATTAKMATNHQAKYPQADMRSTLDASTVRIILEQSWWERYVPVLAVMVSVIVVLLQVFFSNRYQIRSQRRLVKEQLRIDVFRHLTGPIYETQMAFTNAITKMQMP